MKSSKPAKKAAGPSNKAPNATASSQGRRQEGVPASKWRTMNCLHSALDYVASGSFHIFRRESLVNVQWHSICS